MTTRTSYQIEKEMSAIINQIRESSFAKEMKEYRTALSDLALEYAALTNTESETTNKSTAHSLTGISATEYTLPTGQELPQLNWETEGHELDVMLQEIDQVRNSVSWDTFGEDHREWARAWDKEFFRIRKAMGIFDPYSQTW